jgi:hypothetical protein
MRRILLAFFLTLSVLNASAADYYWVNGGGSWSDLNHWRLGSTSGSIPSIVPSSGDNVFFVAGSGFTAGNATVTLNANGFCNNMNWGAVTNNPSFNTASTSFTMQVNGNAVLSPTTTYNVLFAFKGTTPATLTANGNVLGEFGIEIDKPGSSLTLADNLIVPATTNTFGTGGSTLTSGTFDISGKNVTIYNFMSSNTSLRTLQMTNANVTFNSTYRYTGTNKTLNATGSTLLVGGMATDGGIYNKATVTTAGGPNTNVINGTTFSSLTFTSTTQVYSDIEGNNTVDTLVFYGQGALNNGNNIVGYVQFNGAQGYIAANNTIQSALFIGKGNVVSGNTIGKLTAQNNLQISGINTIDSLLLAPNKTTTLAGTLNINKYLKAQGVACEAFTEIIAADTAHIYFAPTASALIDNVNLTYIAAHGNITPIAVSGVDGDGNAGFNITPPASLSGTNLYWVGGAGDWNDNTHWSYTSGGPSGACIPFITDTVIFNSASGLGSSQIVTTSGNAYCYNMKWLPGVGITSFNEPGASAFYIYGSLVLTPGVFMNSMLEFVGTDSTSTITTNGATSGSLLLYIRKKGAGKVTLLDNWTNNAGVIQQVSGGFNMANRTVAINRYSGNSNVARSLNISNANITVSNAWAYYGANKSINSIGSSLTILYSINIDGLTYPKIDAAYNATGNPQAFTISGTTIGALTFTGTNAQSEVNIDSNNIIRRLEFKGAGGILGGGNVIDTLLFAASRNYQITGTSTINKYFLAQSPTCTGLLEIRGATSGTFAFNPAATISMANVYLQNMAATGVPAVALSGADAGGNSGWNISSAAGTPRYWIGGSGDWNDNSHWSTTSGGTGGACIPTVFDDVYFNAGSGFTAGSKTVTVNNGNAYCRNLDWSAATNSPIWNKATAWTIEVWGDTVKLNPTATFTVSPLTFKGNTGAVMQGSALGNFDIRVQKPGGSLQLLNNYTNLLTDIYVNDGTLDLSGRTVSALSINNEGLANTMGINISNANITLDSFWRYNGTATAHTLNAGNSTITSEIFLAAGMTYNNVNVSGITNTGAVFSNATITQLTFTDTNSASQIGINGTNNTIGTLDYKGGGGIYGTGNTINTLIFFPGGTYTLTNGTNTTITGDWYGSGTPCKLTEIRSSSTTANATVTKTNGSVEFDYVRLRRITAAGAGQPFSAQQHTIDQGGNVNWNIAAYNGVAPIYGLGPDTALLATAFPYTLHTDGFFGVPSSQYTWNNSSTADSLVVTDTGTYSVTVTFVDGCTISDNIHITLQVPLPITLISFDAHVQHCQAYLDWKVTDAVNFNKFVIERSSDGRNFTDLAQVTYANGIGEYVYVDKSIDKGTSFYRLRLIDIDGKYQYSKVISVQSGCDDMSIEVYPTVTKGIVLVNLPSSYEGAKIEVFTSLGQLLHLPTSGNTGNAGLYNIQFNGLAQGQYLLKISKDSEIRTFKVFYQP